MKKKLICILCPNGCRLTVESSPQGFVVRGNTCKRGEQYGREEATDPRRVVTAVVRTVSAAWPCVPVKTETAIPKKMIPPLLKHLYSLEVSLPVKRGETCVADFKGGGIRVVYTRTIPIRGGT